METFENIQAGRECLGYLSGSATARVPGLPRPTILIEDPTTNMDVETNPFIRSSLIDQYSEGSLGPAVLLNKLGVNLQSMQSLIGAGVQNWTQWSSTVVFSTLHNLKFENCSFMTEPLTKHVIGDQLQCLGSWDVSTIFVIDPVSNFEHIDELRYVYIEMLIELVGNTYKVPYARSLKDRLSDLLRNWREEHEAGETPSAESLSGLLRFLSSESKLRMPSIVLSPNGTWVAEWRLDSQHLFSAHFLDEANARFIAVVASGKSPKLRPNQVWGEIEVGKLLATAQAYGADRWVCD